MTRGPGSPCAESIDHAGHMGPSRRDGVRAVTGVGPKGAMDSPLRLDAFDVPSPAGRRVAIAVQCEVLDVDAVAGKRKSG